MRITEAPRPWWGPPKKFDEPEPDRKVNWLELFYDLVYVIAIARITHHLSAHITLGSFLEYAFLFILIFWGWLNGSLYHDLHGSEGLRTRLMTLWQMMIIAALAVVIDRAPREGYFNLIVVFMIMQLYITYMWWSVGFYDPSHRRYNKPYTVFYLVSLALLGICLVVGDKWQALIFPFILVCNYIPPFISQRLLRHDSSDLNLSSSMFERMGLFTIIVFGELVFGVVNGIGRVPDLDFRTWLNFALAISIVFALWWIFFTLIAQREVKRGFFNATLLELLFIPTLISLGLMAVCFASFFDPHVELPLQDLLGYAAALFLAGINLMMGLLEFPKEIIGLKRPVRVSLGVTSLVFLSLTIIHVQLERMYYLIGVIVILVLEIIYINSLYYGMKAKEEM